MKENRFAYVAGLIDADGDLTISRSVNKEGYVQYDPMVRIGSSHLPTLKWLVAKFGGYFRKTKPKEGRKPFYIWKFSSDKHASRFLERVHPYLWLKKSQSNVLREYYALAGSHNPVERESLSRRIRGLNQSESHTTNTSRVSLTGKMLQAYLAGAFDGEGSCYILRAKQSQGDSYFYRASISFGNTWKPLVVCFVKKYGGLWRERPPHNFGKLKMYQWDVRDNPTRERFLLYTLPYLVTKREQAKLVLTFIRIQGSNPPLRESLRRRCCQFNGH